MSSITTDRSAAAGVKTPRMFTNPIIRKLNRVNDHTTDGEASATYFGIGVKTFYFLLLTVIGVIIYFAIAPAQLPADGSLSQTMLILLIGASALTILSPIVAWFIPAAIPVIGSLYSISQGLLIPFLASSYDGEVMDLIYLALIITLGIIFIMYVLYAKGIIKVNEKFRSVLTILFFTSIFASVTVFALGFYPPTKELVDFIYTNPLLSIASSVVMIIIASLFLLTDFASIQHTVEDSLPKKYEWLAAFGLAFTVIWLYLKVLTLVAQFSKSN